MYEIIIASVIALVILIGFAVWYFRAPQPKPVPDPVLTPVAPSITYSVAVAGTAETADSPALPGTTIITTPGGTLTQYGQETPVSASEDEHFQPYMSVLTNDMYRSDASFDEPLSKDEPEIYGNYN